MSGGGRSSDASVRARRQKLLELVLERGDVAVRDLAAELGVSAMTAHRDVDALAREQLLLKDRGRAAAPSTLLVQTSAAFRLRAAQDVKTAVAAAALPVLAGAGTVLVDDSTSGLPLLELLGRSGARAAVVTNYLRAAQVAAAAGDLAVHVLGGHYVPELDAVFGPATTEGVARWRADVAVLSNPAVSHGRLHHILPDSAAVKRAMMAAAATTVVLLDSTKLGRSAPHVVCGYADVDVVVVDEHAPAEEVDALRAAGVRVVLAPVPPRPAGTPTAGPRTAGTPTAEPPTAQETRP